MGASVVRADRLADAVATVVLFRIEVRNAFNDEVIAGWTRAFRELDAEDGRHGVSSFLGKSKPLWLAS